MIDKMFGNGDTQLSGEDVEIRTMGIFKYFEPYKSDDELQQLLTELHLEESVKINFVGTYKDMSIINGLRTRINERLKVLGQEILKDKELRLTK